MSFTPSPYSLACARRTLSESVGKPWQIAARGPDSFDCWGFVRWVYGNVGFALPDWLYSVCDDRAALFRNALRAGWIEKDSPCELAVITMGNDGDFSHVGIFFNGFIYHCTRRFGVICTPQSQIENIYNTVKYWWPT